MLSASSITRTLRTVSYITPHQIFWRLRYQLLTWAYRTPFYSFTLPEPEENPAFTVTPSVIIHGQAEKGDDIAEGTFTFNNTPRNLGKNINWFPKADALWVFHLHYHEWLADLRAAGNREAAQEHVKSWLLACDSWHPVAWHPYPISLRVVAWLTHGPWLLEGADPEFTKAFHSSLTRQIVHLFRNPEEGLGANHLIKNLKAMVFAGTCLPAFAETQTSSIARLMRELEKQILPDGGHYERSPLYHKQVLEDVVETAALLAKAGTPNPYLEEKAHQMTAALKFYTFPSGDLPLFNDSARGAATLTQALIARVEGLNPIPPASELPTTGVYKAYKGPLCLMADMGPIGPDEIPGHAHADTLSFEAMWGTDWLIVNSGTFGYQHKWRNMYRGTPAHSTISLEGENLAEVWATFRVGRRPSQTSGGIELKNDGNTVIWGRHNGYRHLGCSQTERILTITPTNGLVGKDTCHTGKPRQKMVSHFHLHPTSRVRLMTETEAEITTAKGHKFALTCEAPARLDVKDSLYAPQFGVQEATHQLQVISRTVGRTPTTHTWALTFKTK